MTQRWQSFRPGAGPALVGQEGKKHPIVQWDPSQGLCRLRRGSAAIRLLGLRVSISPGSWMSLVSVPLCVVSGLTTGRSLVQRSLTECGVYVCDF